MKTGIIETLKTNYFFKIFCYTILALGTTFLLIFLLPQPKYNDGFKSLQDLQKHAQTLDEFRAMENKNYLNPIYEKYYQQKFNLTFAQKVNLKFNQILCFFHIQRPQPIFSCSFFQHILEKITTERLSQGWSNNFIQKINTTKASKLVVFGTTQGAFHPLVRYLLELKKLNIIDESFKVTNPNYYLIFLGNIVNRSPYTLETLTLILKLLECNPRNIIYLKGVNENTYAWKSNTLEKELTMAALQLSIPVQVLEDKVSSFFNTLPITLYCACPPIAGDKKNLFKISPFIEDTKLQTLLQEDAYTNFLTTESQKSLDTFHLQKPVGRLNKNIEKDFTLKAIITDIKKRESYAEMDGLRLLAPTKGVVTWTVLSTSAEAYRKVLKFFYDAFVIITPADQLSDWKITLYNRDIRNYKDQNFQTTPYYFFTGEKA